MHYWSEKCVSGLWLVAAALEKRPQIVETGILQQPGVRGEERVGKYLISLFLNSFFSLLPIFFGRFSLLPDFSPFSLISA